MADWRTLTVTLSTGAIASYVLWSAWEMPSNGHWSTAPALFPILCAGLLLGLSLVPTLSAVCGRESRGGRAENAHPQPQSERWLALALIVLFAGYPGILLPALPFDLATLIYLTTVVGLVLKGNVKPRILIALAAVSLFLPLLFELALGLPLPGKRALCMLWLDVLSNQAGT